MQRASLLWTPADARQARAAIRRAAAAAPALRRAAASASRRPAARGTRAATAARRRRRRARPPWPPPPAPRQGQGCHAEHGRSCAASALHAERSAAHAGRSAPGAPRPAQSMRDPASEHRVSKRMAVLRTDVAQHARVCGAWHGQAHGSQRITDRPAQRGLVSGCRVSGAPGWRTMSSSTS
jgi:hypothetical protein